MELRYLRYFVAVAQTRHFTRAAELLGISQPPLSQQIQRLEHEVGTPLLRRLTRSVELTEAGEAFYEDACRILELSDEALEKAKGIARGVSGTLALGIASSNAFHPLIFSLLRHFQRQYPAMVLLQTEANMAELMSELKEGVMDAAFVRLPCASSKAFELQPIADDPLIIALHRSHPLSLRNEISLEELTDVPVILFPDEVAPGLFERVFVACQSAGLHPEQAHQASQISSSLSMVAAGFGFALVPASMQCFSHPDVTYHPLRGTVLKSEIALAWRRHERSPAVKKLVAMFTHLHEEVSGTKDTQ